MLGDVRLILLPSVSGYFGFPEQASQLSYVHIFWEAHAPDSCMHYALGLLQECTKEKGLPGFPTTPQINDS